MTDPCPMPPYSSLKRSTKPIRAKKKALVRVGKVSGKVRLSGQALEKLRRECWFRDEGRCQICNKWVLILKTVPPCHPDKYDMAHIKSRGAGGSDTLDNVRTLCHACHMKEHAKGLKG